MLAENGHEKGDGEGWFQTETMWRIIARNDLLFSRPIKPAICWSSEETTRADKLK